MSFFAVASVLGAHLLAVISPGPDFFVAVRTSLSHGRRSGCFAAVGFGLGILVHVAYSIAGIALVISQSIIAFQTIKVAGALYLIWLGYQSFTAKNTTEHGTKSIAKAKELSPLNAIKLGFLTNVLNPKATLFFLGLFTLMITPETPLLAQAAIGFIMAINTTLWFCAISYFFTTEKIRRGFLRFQGWFNRAFGVILWVIGLRVLLSPDA